MNENSMKSCMNVVLIPARMPARSGWHMAALVPLKGLGADWFRPVTTVPTTNDNWLDMVRLLVAQLLQEDQPVEVPVVPKWG
jgi:hypothetical protein